MTLTIGLPHLPDFDGDDPKPQAPVSAGIDLALGLFVPRMRDHNTRRFELLDAVATHGMGTGRAAGASAGNSSLL